ncbi:MAG: hypothetical protein NZ866_02565 [Patescibacteria group bacterium]|nr:hypothetical protein [Patescibacteria group bacterium]
MEKIILTLIFTSLLLFPYTTLAFGLPYGTPRVITPPIYCLNGGVMIGVQPTIPLANPPGLYFVPYGTNRYQYFIYPPFPGVKMLGKYIPGGFCLIPSFPFPIPIPTVGTITEYGSAIGF